MKCLSVSRSATGFGMVAASSILFGILPVFVKEASRCGMDVFSLTIYRIMVMVLLSAGIVTVRKISFRVTFHQLCQLALFGIVGSGLTSLLLSGSYLFVNMGTATICHFIYPVLVMLMMRFFFREGCEGLKKPALFSALCGIVILALAGGGGQFGGIALAVLSGLTYGVYVISLEKSSFRDLDPYLVIFYGCGSCLVVFSLYSLFTGKTCSLDVPSGTWVNIGLAGSFGTIATMLLCGGVRILGSSTAAFLNMLEPITNTFVDLLVYSAFPNLVGWAGYGLMLLSIFFISLQKSREEKQAASG